jgi:CheY-like chemotaxis protein
MAELLVVDDNQDFTELLALMLGGLGHAVRAAPDGRIGLLLAEQLCPDLIILDIEMPDLDGPGMAAELRARGEPLSGVPIILLSGSTSTAEVAARLGTPYFLTKPCDLGELRALLGRALSEKKAPLPRDASAP